MLLGRAQRESRWFASPELDSMAKLVKNGTATWKAGLDLQKVRRAIDDWQTEKNVEPAKEIMN